ncbi:hypothetical protein [Rhodanobacter sp. A1T4]|uniref:hypothetical protein n=1 Tax=Rhodanobacter sp. A1T4 TaxID=2723087 RepID=UPI001612A066|nr:hypothetical protein [Rhodanobacter sp. A1T4]MBB6249393.1 hypothetical protein [Rhodanobacter sp. A1T4]
MSYQAKKRIFAALSVLMILTAIYSALGVLQAASLFTGERALRNLNFWGTIMCVAFACSALFGFLAFRASRLAKVGSREAV